MDRQSFDDLSDANNVLLLAPPESEFSDEACSSLLTGAPAGRSSLISVTFGQSPAQRLSFWETHVGGDLPDRTAVIAMGETDETDADALEKEVDVVDHVTVRSIADPTDTMALGIELTWVLSEWATEGDSVVCCVYTLSELIQEAGYTHTVELLLRLFDWTKRLDARFHYHLDPGAHPDAVVELLRPLFDVVVEPQSDGDSHVERHETPRELLATLSDGVGRKGTISQDTAFDLLTDRRRRELLYRLQELEPGESATVAELVDHLLEGERRRRADEPVDFRDQIGVSLRHYHLPRLADAGVVGYDDDVVVRRDWGWQLELWVAQAAFLEE